MSIYSWQQQQWELLFHVFQKNSLPHAILLNGQLGLGKYDFAKAFAKFLLCSSAEKMKYKAACEQCKQCNLVDKETNPDLQSLQLEDDANVIKLDQVRELISFINNTAQYDQFKIIIICPAEKMNIAAANALLKSLEEPVGNNTIYFLVSHQFMRLPATIRSRCQRIDFYPPPLAELRCWLNAEQINHTEDEFLSAYQCSQGSPLILKNYLINPDYKNIKNTLQLLNTLKNNQQFLISEVVENFNKLSTLDFLQCLQLTIMNWIKTDVSLNNTSLHYLLDDIAQRKKALENGVTLNPQLLIEDYLIQIGQQHVD